MRTLRYAFLTTLAALVAAWGGEANAGPNIPFSYTSSVNQTQVSALTYQYFGNASGKVTETSVSQSNPNATTGIFPAPANDLAGNPVATVTTGYHGGPLTSGDFYIVSGTVDVTVTVTTVSGVYNGVKVTGGTGKFTIAEDFANLVTINGRGQITQVAPALNGEGQEVKIGNVIVVLNALAEGNNINVQKNQVFAGFEFFTTPEPGSMVMTGLGSLAIGGLAIRRRRKATA